MAWKRTGPDPDAGGSATAQVTESVYDAAGRILAERKNADGWTCTTYDSRGRPLSQSIPAFGAEPARIVTWSWSVGGNPLVTSMSDASGTITATSDLLGRPISYTDVWSKTTTTTYDQPGRVGTVVGPQGTVGFTYDAAGRIATQTLDGTTVATPTYTTGGELATVGYSNNTSLATITRSPSGGITGLTFNTGGSLLTSDSVTRTQSGRIVDEAIDGVDTDGANPNFAYDAAGRLTSAKVPGHTITYGFASTGGCGLLTTAGKNTNRTSLVDNGATTTYCYDNADRLVSATGFASIAYDSHANTTTLGATTLTYDGTDRSTAITAGGTNDRYVRDASGRIVAVKQGATTLARYAYSGPGDAPSAVLDSSSAVIDRLVGLPGGASIRKRAGADLWTYPNVHGDTAALANSTGAKQGATRTYDPYGQPLAGIPDSYTGPLDPGWLGGPQRLTDTSNNIIQMGERPYAPSLGRFLRVDPIFGGSCNNYDYTCADPVDGTDISGMFYFDSAGMVAPSKAYAPPPVPNMFVVTKEEKAKGSVSIKSDVVAVIPWCPLDQCPGSEFQTRTTIEYYIGYLYEPAGRSGTLWDVGLKRMKRTITETRWVPGVYDRNNGSDISYHFGWSSPRESWTIVDDLGGHEWTATGTTFVGGRTFRFFMGNG